MTGDSVGQHMDVWDRFVSGHPDAAFFHTSVWQNVLQRSFGYEPFSVVLPKDSGAFAGLLPFMLVQSRLTGRRLLSLPFSYVCGPLAENPDALELLLAEAVRIARSERCRFLEIKQAEPLIEGRTLGFCETQHYKTFLLDLEVTSEKLWLGLHKNSTQRSIEKGRREGIKIHFADEWRHWETFYRLHLLTSRTHGVPPQPLDFFRHLFENMQTEKLAQLVLAFKGNGPAAGAIFFLYKERVIYMYGASHPDYLPYRPNHVLLWEVIGWAQTKGFKVFDLGRVSQENAGLAQFKARWGAREHQLYSYFWPSAGGLGVMDRTGWKYKLVTGVFQKVPLPVFRSLSFLYKHLA